MSDQFLLSSDALVALTTWLPTGLTGEQGDKILKAARCMAQVVHTETRRAVMAERNYYTQVKTEGPSDV